MASTLINMCAVLLALSNGPSPGAPQVPQRLPAPGGPPQHRSDSLTEAPSAAPVVQLQSEPSARLITYPPIPSQLAEGRVVIQYRTENLIIRPVFGEAALGVSPRIGHLHITVDGASWRWLDASNEPVIVNGLPPGQHTILIELVTPTHKTIDKQLVSFAIPPRRAVGNPPGAP
jgi:hypothetical protein